MILGLLPAAVGAIAPHGEGCGDGGSRLADRGLAGRCD
jgi:hypothetical protein